MKKPLRYKKSCSEYSLQETWIEGDIAQEDNDVFQLELRNTIWEAALRQKYCCLRSCTSWPNELTQEKINLASAKSLKNDKSWILAYVLIDFE